MRGNAEERGASDATNPAELEQGRDSAWALHVLRDDPTVEALGSAVASDAWETVGPDVSGKSDQEGLGPVCTR